jgi:hypothetical protein
LLLLHEDWDSGCSGGKEKEESKEQLGWALVDEAGAGAAMSVIV